MYKFKLLLLKVPKLYSGETDKKNWAEFIKEISFFSKEAVQNQYD
jgi:hypothetical protein